MFFFALRLMSTGITSISLAEYPATYRIGTRWSDNDVYGHVNNVVYYSWFDTVINTYLIEQGGLDIQKATVIGICAESQCKYKKSVSYPDAVVGGLYISKLGISSVRYEVGIFKEGEEETPLAFGYFTHVFTDKETRKPCPIPQPVRTALQRLLKAIPASDVTVKHKL